MTWGLTPHATDQSANVRNCDSNEAVKEAPDVEMALMLARETHFRHKEGVAYAVRRRGDHELHVGSYGGDVLGGVTDHSYRRQ